MLPLPYIAAGALAVGLLTGWTANGWRLNGKIDEMVLEHTQAVLVATQQAAAETTRMQGEKDAAVQSCFRLERLLQEEKFKNKDLQSQLKIKDIEI